MVAISGPPFVGRAAELDRLAALYRRTLEGDPAVVIVGGEAGVGKSRLVTEFARRIEGDRPRVLEGACLELTDGPPYAPIVEILRDLVRRSTDDELPRVLGPGRRDLARLLPELEGGPPSERHGDDTRQRAQARLYEVVLGAFERAARLHPLVLVVEDLQWSDRSTRDLLAFLVRGLRDDPVMIVLTSRSDEVGGRHPILPYLAELERIERVERIELGPLRRADVAALVAAAVDGAATDRLVDALVARTDGNPFFVEQLLAVDGEPGDVGPGDAPDLPPRLRDVLAARIGSLSDPARDVLRVAAVGGRSVDDRLLADVVSMPADELHDALREAVDRQILVRVRPPGPPSDTEAAYAFRHALLQEVALEELFAGERQKLHAAYAEALTRRAAGDASGTGIAAVPPSELAFHWDAARDWRRALPATVDAASAAERAFAFAEALRHYERALEIWDRIPNADDLFLGDRATLLERAAEMAVLTGEYDRAVELGRAAVAAIPDSADDARRGLYHERLRWFLWEAGDRPAAEASLEIAAGLVPDHPPSAARARVLGQLAGLHMVAGRFSDSRIEADAALAQARAAGARTETAMALGVRGRDLAMLGDVDAGIADVGEALRIAQETGSVEGIALGYATLAALLDLVGRSEEAVATAREGRATVDRLGVARTYGGLLLASEASALLALGRWSEAGPLLTAGLEREPSRRAGAALHLQAARLATGRGAFEDASRHLVSARTNDDTRAGGDQRVGILAATAELAMWERRTDDVRSAVAAGLETLAEVPEPAHAWLAAVGIRAEADAAERARARQDQPAIEETVARGQELAARLVSFAGAGNDGLARRFAALGLLGAAESARLLGTPASEPWGRAADAFEAQARPYPTAYARYREAEALLAAGEGRQGAEGPLRAASTVAAALGAEPLRREIEQLGRQARIALPGVSGPAGGGPMTAAPARLDTFGLTERELEVLRLVAAGWTNRQIGEGLFISTKTASVHVSNILGKLGVDSRVEAAAIAHRLGLALDAPPPPDSIAADRPA